jgi:hypothetical protein
MFEERISSRWSDLYRGDPLAIRTVTRVRSLIEELARTNNYEIVLVDTSPSLGSLNKAIISTVDAFLIPCLPDVFSLYGIRNIGRALEEWIAQFSVIFGLLSAEKRAPFPQFPVGFLGFTIFNAKKYSGASPWDLAKAHFNYARRIPTTISEFIPESVRVGLDAELMEAPIGGTAVMHTHNTLPAMAHKYHCPIWQVPALQNLEADDKGTIVGNRARYEQTEDAYKEFASAVLERTAKIEHARE